MAKSQASRSKERSSSALMINSADNSSLLWRLVGILPVALPAALAAFGLVALSLVVLGQFRGWLVWSLGLLASLAAMLLVYKFGSGIDRPGNLKEQRWGDVLIIVGALAWIGLNVGYTSQHVFTDRDPAAYAIAGAWLAGHDNLDIKTTPAFGDSQVLESASSGFNTLGSKGERIYPHGEHMLPSLLGAAGKIVGEVHIFKMNVLVGGVALLAFYGFARLFVRPRWALLAVGVMAVSLPMLYFSRDIYTEPLMAAFAFGSLALLFMGQKSRRSILWLLAGVLAGAAVATRIDAILNIAALALFAVTFLALSKKHERKRNIVNVALMAAGITTVSAVGMLDAINLSPVYYYDHERYFYQVIYLIAAILAAGVGVVYVAWRTKLLGKLDTLTKGWRTVAVFFFVITGMAVLASRPLWQGDPIDTIYATIAVNWVAWYTGAFVVALGTIGVAIVSARITAGRDLFLSAAVLVLAVAAILYFIRPNVSPDQIWGSRRFLPVVMPGLAIFMAYALDKLSQRYFEKWRRGKLVSAFLIVLIMAAPLSASWPFLRHSEKTQYEAISNVCAQLPDNAAVLWIGKARLEAVQPTRTFCNAPSMGYVKDDDFFDGKNGTKVLQTLAANAHAQGYLPVVGVYGSQAGLIKESERKDLIVIDFNFKFMEITRDRPPNKVLERNDQILLGIINLDGNLNRIQ